MNCSDCEEFQEPRPIRLPAALTTAIQSLQAAVEDGRLANFPVHDNDLNIDFSTVRAHGPWEDHIYSAFRCTRCSQQYRLVAETYHGRGGILEPVDSA